jgi:hypothetical protein
MDDETHHIQFQPPEGTPTAPGTPFSIIRNFLDNSPPDLILHHADATARELASQVSTSSLDNNFPFNPADYVHTIFSSLIDMVIQIPHNHAWQRRLVSLVRALKSQPDPPAFVSQAVCNSWGMPEFKWERLPTFAMQQGELFLSRSRFEDPPRTRRVWDNRVSPEEWTNINKFIALLVAEDLVTGMGLDNSGFSVLKHTLESRRSVQVLEENIPAAAIWILTTKEWVYKRNLLENTVRVYESRIEEYDGPDGLTGERWEFWNLKFKSLSLRDDLSDKTRSWAHNAADYMTTEEA